LSAQQNPARAQWLPLLDHGPKIYMLPRTYPLVVLSLRTSPLIIQLRSSPPVVQHTWSNNYEPSRSQQPSSVSTEHTNLPARILTREHHNMNLPAHDTVKHLLVQVHIWWRIILFLFKMIEWCELIKKAKWNPHWTLR